MADGWKTNGGAPPGPPADPPDRLVEWLTRQEWNACYFLGQEVFYRGRVDCGLCDQVAIGIQRLHCAGYAFSHLGTGRSGLCAPPPGAPPPGEHESSCTEVGAGSFDDVGRARAALDWLRRQVPAVSTAWLEGLLAAYDRVHSTDPKGRGESLGDDAPSEPPSRSGGVREADER